MNRPGKSSWRFFKPTPADCLLIMAVLYWLLCAVCSMEWYAQPALVDPLIALFVLPFGALAAIGAAAANRRCNFRMTIWLIPIILVGVVCTYLVGWMTTSALPTVLLNIPTDESNTSWVSYTLLVGAALFATMVVPWLAILIFNFVLSKTLTAGGVFNTKRTRNLIILAVCLFGIAKVGSLLDLLGFEASSMGWLQVIFSVCFSVALFWLAVCVPAWVLSSRRKFELKFALTVVVVAVAIGTVAVTVFDNINSYGSYIDFLSRCSIPLFYLFSFLAFSCWPIETEGNIALRSTGPSVWTLVFAVPILAVATVGLYFYDPAFLFQDHPNASFVDPNAPLNLSRVELASMSRTINRESKGAVRLHSYAGQELLFIDAELHHDPDCLTVLTTAPKYQWIIDGIHPGIDTSMLKNHGRGLISISGGKFSSQQLSDLYPGCLQIYFCGPCEFPEKLDPTIPIPNLNFLAEYKSDVAKILDSHITKADNNVVQIWQKLSTDDWDAVVRASQFRQVRVSVVPREILTQEFAEGSLKNIRLDLDVSDKEKVEFARRTGISARYSGGSDQQRWDWSFAFPFLTDGNWNRLGFKAGTVDDFRRQAKEFNWAYKWNADDEIMKIWLPETEIIEANLEALAKVETLRMDVRGINAAFPVGGGIIENKTLRKLTKLKRLYLPAEVPLTDLVFLASLNNLKHLQIEAPDRSLQKGTGFEACQSLESIRILGIPDQKTIAELMQLKNLKRIVIVENLLDPRELSDADRAKFEGVSLEIIRADEFETDYDEDLKVHLNSIEARIR